MSTSRQQTWEDRNIQIEETNQPTLRMIWKKWEESRQGCRRV